jgi:hypothetical protein
MNNEEVLKAFRLYINKLCGLNPHNERFPGTLPVSLARADVPALYGMTQTHFTEYILSYKADGFDGGRYFLVFLTVHGEHYAVLLDRQFFPVYLSLQVYTSALLGTVFDVELLRLPDQTYLILIFDTLAINGNNVTSSHYLTRLELARRFLDHTVNINQNISYTTHQTDPKAYPSRFPDIQICNGTYNKAALKIQVKQVYYAQALQRLNVNTHYPTDGFIWTLGTAAYSPFRTNMECVFKWKPLEWVTVDFFVKLDPTEGPNPRDDIPDKYRVTMGQYGLFADSGGGLISISKFESSQTLYGVYEFQWSGTRWSLKQSRPDKTKPNQLQTVIRTINNLTENILLSEIQPK